MGLPREGFTQCCQRELSEARSTVAAVTYTTGKPGCQETPARSRSRGK